MITTLKQLQKEIEKLMPNADIQTDGKGQIIIYTGLTTPWLMDIVHSDDDDTIIKYDP